MDVLQLLLGLAVGDDELGAVGRELDEGLVAVEVLHDFLERVIVLKTVHFVCHQEVSDLVYLVDLVIMRDCVDLFLVGIVLSFVVSDLVVATWFLHWFGW